LVLFGATGFTGRLVAAHLAMRYQDKPFNWAIAGRNREKLLQLQQDICLEWPQARPDCLVAHCDDQASLETMTGKTRVLLTTAGPYIHHGLPVARACVRSRTHYCDLTGEPEYVDLLMQQVDAEARAQGVRIVNCCGFDSIPHDFGVFYTSQQVNAALGHVPQSLIIEGFVRSKGRFSGGTWHSAVHAFARQPMSRLVSLPGQRRQSRHNLRQSHSRHVEALQPMISYRKKFAAWSCPLPTIDPQVVLRTAQTMDSYGEEFLYGHYVLVKRLPQMVLGLAAVGGIFSMARFRPTRNWLLKRQARGEGPSAEVRKRSHFSVTFSARADGKRLLTQVSGGDPGYDETARMLGETGLCLALDKELPEHAGVITPVLAGGAPLLKRLQQVLTFRVIDKSRLQD
jgi:short subunit dehydrogenase-like uncharacterized protein